MDLATQRKVFFGHFLEVETSKEDGPFRISKKLNSNVFQIELHRNSNISATFNGADLTFY